jgi:hypothetical protein
LVRNTAGGEVGWIEVRNARGVRFNPIRFGSVRFGSTRRGRMGEWVDRIVVCVEFGAE